MEAPRYVIPANYGGVQFLSPDMLNRLYNHVGLTDSSHRWVATSVFDMHKTLAACTTTHKSYGELVGLDGDEDDQKGPNSPFNVLLTVRSSIVGPHAGPLSTNAAVVGEMQSGRVQIKPESWKELLRVAKPNMAIQLYDSCDEGSLQNKKRKTCETRSELWVKACVKPEENKDCVTLVPSGVASDSKQATAGLAFTNARAVPSLGGWLAQVGNQPEAVKYATASTITEILHLMNLGTTYIESNLPFVLAQRGCALDLCFKQCAGEGGQPEEWECATPSGEGPILDLHDPVYRKVKDNILSCPCYAEMLPEVAQYSKGYIHHLLVAHEMNSTIILSLVNVSITLQLFKTFNRLAENKEAQRKFLKSVAKQFSTFA